MKEWIPYQEGNKMSDLISRQAAIDALGEQLDYLWRLNKNENPTAKSKLYGVNWARNTIADLPPAQTEWNNHTVACLLAELFGDTCACNYNDIDEWLPKKCELLDSCPNPVGVACWEQFLKHKAERRPMKDVIYRQAAIDALNFGAELLRRNCGADMRGEDE